MQITGKKTMKWEAMIWKKLESLLDFSWSLPWKLSRCFLFFQQQSLIQGLLVSDFFFILRTNILWTTKIYLFLRSRNISDIITCYFFYYFHVLVVGRILAVELWNLGILVLWHFVEWLWESYNISEFQPLCLQRKHDIVKIKWK